MEDTIAAIHSISRRRQGTDKIVFGKPVKARPAHISRRMRPEEAFRATLSDCLAQINANAASLRAGRSVEGLHQLRVAFRRLEVALGAFGKEFRQDWLEELRGRAKILLGRLSAARDLDVFVEKLLAQPPGISGEGLAALRARAENARDAAWEQAGQCIASPEFELFADDVAALASSQLPLTHRRLPKTAARILDRQIRRVKKRGKTARSREEGDMHRLRIALKKLRYSAEFFAPLYPRKDVRRYLEKLKGLQNHLGDLNDVANVHDVVNAILRDGKTRKDAQPPMCFAAGSVAGWFDAQTPRAISRALKRYKKFKRVTPFWVRAE
jgi:CHAD domain-containing protein